MPTHTVEPEHKVQRSVGSMAAKPESPAFGDHFSAAPGVPLFLQRSCSGCDGGDACAACSARRTPTVQRACADCQGRDSADQCSDCREEEAGVQRDVDPHGHPPRPSGTVRVGPAEDVYEREAESFASRLVQASTRAVGTAALGRAGGRDVQRACSSCAGAASTLGEEEPRRLQRATSTTGGAHPAPPSSLDSVVASPGPGHAVAPQIRARVEPALNADLSSVRVHADATSERAAHDIGARAFTFGSHIFLGAGQSSDDLELMAHELTHTVQQGASPPLGDGGDGPGGQPARPSAQASRHPAGPPAPRVQRWPSVDDVLGFVEDTATSAGEAIGDAAETAGEALGDAADTVVSTAEEVGTAIYDTGAAAVEAAGEAIDWLATEAGQAASAIADAFGGILTVLEEGLVITIPTICLDDPFVYSFDLPSMSRDFMVPIFGIPLGPLVLTGEVGLVGALRPMAQLQLGPFCLVGPRIVISPLTGTYSISGGSLSATAAASVGAEIRGGLRAALALTGVVPIGGVPVPISVPLVGLEGGLAGLFRAIGGGTITVGGSASLTGTTFSAAHRGTFDLGFGADMFLGAYAGLDILGQNVCRIYWQPYEWHGGIAGSFGFGIGLTLTGGRSPGAALAVPAPTFDRIPFDDLPLALSREGFADACPIIDALCFVLRSLNYLPSQNGGTWNWFGPYGPGPLVPGPLECYRTDPGIPSTATCRGACGPNCDTCEAPIAAHLYTDPVTGETWEYRGFRVCNSNDGCREHDAAYDWAADKHGEMGSWAVIMPWHMAANIECACNNLAGNCLAWIGGLPPYDSTMYFADSAVLVPGGPGSLSNECAEEFPNAPACAGEIPDRDSFLADWGLPRGLVNFRDCTVVADFTAGSMVGCGGGPVKSWRCTATDLGSGQAVTVGVFECICCKSDNSSGSSWVDPAVVVTPDMSEELILDLCARGLIPAVICGPLEEEMIRRFGNRRRDLDLDPDEDPKTEPRPDDAAIFASFRRIYNRLESWVIFVRTKHPELQAEFAAEFKLDVKRAEWLSRLKARTAEFKERFRDLRNSDPALAAQEYERAVLGGIQAEVEEEIRRVAEWYRQRTGTTEPIDELIERVHAEGTELWRARWRRAILEVNRVLSLLWPSAKTQLLVFVGQQRAAHPELDLSGPVGDIDYIGSLATGFKGPPKQHIRFNPEKFDVDANLVAPPLATYAIHVDRRTPDRQRIFGRTTTITPLIAFSDRAHADLRARVAGYDGSDPFDVVINSPELPVQERERVATERLFTLRRDLDPARYRDMIRQIDAEGFLRLDGTVRGDLTDAQFDRLNAIMDEFAPPPRRPR